MKKIIIPILVASLYLLAYQIAPFIGAKPVVIASMFGIAPFVVVFMVVKVIKEGKHSGKTLTGEFGYEDYDTHIGI